MDLDRRGLAFGFAAYLFWGFFPLYFLLVAAASAPEVIAHRIFWTLLISLAGVLAVRQWGVLRSVLRDWRITLRLVSAGVLVAANWSVYVWAVLNDRLVDASLGYFVNPLVTVLFAMAFLGERPRVLQLVALGIGSAAVLVIAIWYGQVPWISLLLALSFGAYSLLKKQVSAQVTPLVGLTLETAALAPFALGFIIWLQVGGTGTLLSAGSVHTVAMLAAGLVTAGPLLLFAAATRRIPLTMVGLLQYICPVLQFLLGVTIFGESMPPARWVGFALIWVALVVLSVDLVRAGRRKVGKVA